MLKGTKIVLISVSAFLFTVMSDVIVTAAEVTGKPRVKVPEMSQERQVINTMLQLGFTVESAHRLRDGSWEVRVGDFDGRRANFAYRGAVVATSANVGGMRSSATAQDSGTAGRGVAVGPRGGGSRSEQDGSTTGGGNSGGPEGSSGGGRDGGPLASSDNQGGSATGGGNTGGVVPGTNPRGRGAALRVSVAADGTIVVNAASLRQAGYANSFSKTANGQVTFR